MEQYKILRKQGKKGDPNSLLASISVFDSYLFLSHIVLFCVIQFSQFSPDSLVVFLIFLFFRIKLIHNIDLLVIVVAATEWIFLNLLNSELDRNMCAN